MPELRHHAPRRRAIDGGARRSRCRQMSPPSATAYLSAGERVTLLLRRVGVRRRATAQLLMLHIAAGADPTTGILTCEREVLAGLLGIAAGSVQKTLNRLATDGLELRIPYGVGADDRPL